MVNELPNKALAKKLNYWAIAISIVVLALVGIMRRPEFRWQTEIDFSFLPGIYSAVNVLVAMVLIYAISAIKKGRVEQHKKAVTTAMVLSGLFLLLYVLYHFTSDSIKYCGVGKIRIVYFVLLITHILLAATSFPFILFTYIRGYTWQTERHKKLARWVFPIWLYVAISGPVVYLMLRPCI